MWIIVSFIFLVAALFSQNSVWWIVWAMMIISHNLELIAAEIRNKHKTDGSLQ